MNKQFLETIFNEQQHDLAGAQEALRYLVKTVFETNEMIGMDYHDRDKWLPIYYKLRVEEGSELITAIDNEDAVEVVDAILDTLVVGCYENLVDGTECFDSDFLKSLSVLKCNTQMYSLHEDIRDFQSGLQKFSTIQNTFIITCSLFAQLNIDHMKAVKEVTESNLSKFPTLDQLLGDFVGETGKDLGSFVLNQQCEMIESGKRYSGVTAETVANTSGETRYVFWASHEYGKPKVKYVKPCTFKEPDFASCLIERV